MIKSFLRSNAVAFEFSDREHGWAERGQSVIDCIREYPTYNDGLVKHGNSYKVQPENFVDCLVSVYDYLTAGINGDTPVTRADELKRIESSWPHSYTFDTKKIAFFASLKYVDGKRRFYEKDEMKVSSAESKQYDRRWNEIPSWADGTFDATWRFMREHVNVYDTVQQFALFEAVKEWYDNNHGYGFAKTYERNGIGTDTPYNDIAAAFRIMDSLVTAFRGKEKAKRSRESLQWNLIDSKKQAA